MKNSRGPVLWIVLAVVAVGAFAAAGDEAVSYAPPPLEKGVPAALVLPEGFKPPKDSKRESLGWRRTAGVSLEKQGGTVPVYVLEDDRGRIPNNVLVVGDLILAVNGKALGERGARDFRAAMNKSRKESGFFWLTRYRNGTVERCLVDLGEKPLDLTKTLAPGPSRDWRLGPLGVNGWCFHRRTRHGASQDARQIIITAVDADGPCAGKLQVKDIILGTNGEAFSYDARKALAAAINEAEMAENKGELPLLVFRPMAGGEIGEGETLTVTITLPVLGTYSATAPFDCPKTDRIIDNAVTYMKANAETLLKPSDKGWLNYINGLGLLATGREDVMPLVRDLAHASLLKDGETLSVDKHVSMMCWWWSYKTVFLCEYYLRTGDEAVLPTIREHATAIAMGQSGAGTWGHTYAARENTGYLHGHLGGYGAINQQGLTLMIALPLAVKCGVTNQEIVDAIKRGDEFFSFFIGKGTIPYGDHGAASQWYDDNGKSGAAAIFFDLMDNRKGATFFSEMVLGSTPGGREVGHTGHYWSHLWGGMGAARGGDRALQVFMQEMNPIFTLERQPNGRFAFQDNAGEAGPKGDPKEKWDSTGARLLQLCVPRRALCITGKETPRETHLSQERIEEILKAGRLDVDQDARAELTQEEILAFLKDPLPATRAMAAKTLAERNINCVPQLIAMLDSDNKYARYGAAEALCNAGFGSKAAADKLIRLMQTSTDVTFQTYAIAALINRDKERGLLSVARPAIPVLMEMALKSSPEDPRKVLQHDIGRALFYNGSAQPRRGLLPEYGLEGIDRSKLVPVAREILSNKNGWARSTMSSWLYPQLTEAEREQLWGDIYKASYRIAPSGIMFAPGNRLHGLKLMSENHIKEGLDLAVWYVRYQKFHASKRRMPTVLAAIEGYGAHAKPFLPALREYATHYEKHEKTALHGAADMIRATIKKIEALPDEPTFPLVSIEGTLKQMGLAFPPAPIRIQEDG